MIHTVKDVERINKQEIHQPTLIIYASKDQIIDTSSLHRVFNEWGSPVKKLVVFDESDDPGQHILAGDIMSPTSTEALAQIILDFLRPQIHLMPQANETKHYPRPIE